VLRLAQGHAALAFSHLLGVDAGDSKRPVDLAFCRLPSEGGVVLVLGPVDAASDGAAGHGRDGERRP
jgi:hypothetical protein